MEGAIVVRLGLRTYFAKKGESIYFHASEEHQIINDGNKAATVLLVVTDSYL